MEHLEGSKLAPPMTFTRDNDSRSHIPNLVLSGPTDPATYANKSHTHIFIQRNQLQNIKKASKSVTEYLHEVRSVSNALKVASSPVQDEELILKIISGLGPEYREIYAAVRAWDASLSYEELFHKLTNHELFLKHQDLEKSFSNITTAVAQRRNMPAKSNRNNRLFNNQQRKQYVCRFKSHNHFDAKPNFASNLQSTNNSWVVDSGATYHVTAEPHNLEEYIGNKGISMGDGNTIPITHTGSTQIQTCILRSCWYKAGIRMDSMNGRICQPDHQYPSISPPQRILAPSILAIYCESPIPEHHPMPIPEPAPNRITIRSQNNITKPKRHLSFTTHVTPTPTTFKQATIYEELKQAMKVEYDALKKNQAWELNLVATIYVLIYVDDILITRSHPVLIRHVFDSLGSRFSLKDLGYLNYFLGAEVKNVSGDPLLTQSKYILDILSKLDMQDCRGVLIPKCSGKLPREADGSPPAIATSTGALSKAVKRILRFLKATTTSSLHILHNSDCNLSMYADVDWVGDPNDRISTSGYVFFFGRNPVSWSSKKQQLVARSSTEADYKSIANALTELTCVHNLLNELCTTIPNIPTIFCDNVGVTYLYQNLVFHSRMKHIVVDFCYVRNQLQAHRVLVKHTHACDQLADTFTKPLPAPSFARCRSNLGVIEPHLT
ncbi:hypothetical protein KY284_010962 [Solanum tuberosum]|nr:hypothetical protein KY284_010962 [Solanum tuberosum]